MSRSPFEEFVYRFERQDHPMDYPEAMVRLYDAMRDYLRADEALANELLREEHITIEQLNTWMAANEPLVTWLKKHEDDDINPTLYPLGRGY